MLAFAPHMTLGSPGDDSLKAYNQGTHALLEEFLEGVAGHEAVSSDQSQETMVLFAAMIGARTIAQATGSLKWTRELEVAVVEVAKSGAFSADA